MGWSFRIGRLAGIDIFVHFTFLLLLAFVGLNGFLRTGDLVAGLVGVGMIAAVFWIVVLHELGHALAARYYGIPTKDITLLPIGGVARLQRMPEKPAQELVVALAGPAVNVVLGLFFGAIFYLNLNGPAAPADPERALTFQMGVVEELFYINIGLVLFNLLPAFPMDGGRVLRALLAMRLGARRATEVAALVGKVMAVLFGVVGVFGVPGVIDQNPMLALVGLFVWMGADTEARAIRARAGLAGVPVAAVMARRFAAVDPDDTLGAVADYAQRALQRDFPVVVAGRVVGLLGREELRVGLIEHGPTARVFQVMRREFATVGPDEPAERGLALVSEGAPVVPVVAYGQLAGMLTPEHLAEFVWVRGQGRGELAHGHDTRTPA